MPDASTVEPLDGIPVNDCKNNVVSHYVDSTLVGSYAYDGQFASSSWI